MEPSAHQFPKRTFGKKVLSIGAAITAIFSQQPNLVADTSPFRLPTQVITKTALTDERRIQRATPLVLKPAARKVIQVGHSSHKSHSSHGSHTSGSYVRSHNDHASHVSSVQSLIPRVQTRSTTVNPVRTKEPDLTDTTPTSPIPEQKPSRVVNLPEQRYRLVKIAKVRGLGYATIIDTKTNVTHIAAAGDKVGAYELWLVDEAKNLVKMRGTNLDNATLKLTDQGAE